MYQYSSVSVNTRQNISPIVLRVRLGSWRSDRKRYIKYWCWKGDACAAIALIRPAGRHYCGRQSVASAARTDGRAGRRAPVRSTAATQAARSRSRKGSSRISRKRQQSVNRRPSISNSMAANDVDRLDGRRVVPSVMSSFYAAGCLSTGDLLSATVRDSYNLKSHRYVCITTYQPDTKSNPNPNPNPNPTTKQHAILNIQLNIVTCTTYPDKFTRDNVVAPSVRL